MSNGPQSLLSRPWQKVSALAKGVLQSGLTPEKLALTICLGASIAVMPIPWTTVICLLFAARLRLNQAAMQGVNYLCYPLQIALFVPFCRMGEALIPFGPKVSAALLSAAMHGQFGSAASQILWACLRGLGAWAITIPPLALLCYPVLKRILQKRKATEA